MIDFFDSITEMSITQFIFLCLCIMCITCILVAFFRIFWNRKDKD